MDQTKVGWECRKEEAKENDGENDLQQIREQFAAEGARVRGEWTTTMGQVDLFNAQLMKRLCVADLDAARVAELEQQIRVEKEQHAKNARQILQLQTEQISLRNRVQKFENGVPKRGGGGRNDNGDVGHSSAEDDLKLWAEKGQREQIFEQCIQGLQASVDHHTLQKVAEILDKPISAGMPPPNRRHSRMVPQTNPHKRHPPSPPPKKVAPVNSTPLNASSSAASSSSNRPIAERNKNIKIKTSGRNHSPLLTRLLGPIMDEEETKEEEEISSSANQRKNNN